MQPIHFLFAFMIATVMASPINEGQSKALAERQQSDKDDRTELMGMATDRINGNRQNTSLVG
ncbi:hypothetical protein N7471_011914 [Penicillium samsonianum]|uniref:uncharacterized protein n=1 Tax=Penicillium samsonianum TaxID=1882272 RepID=UPI0025478288|nr:uncharacterized protein N7471_011914 [Penicillium samsonianum]KAJ6124597.1 hypothetical protein N7471_011914 [Penicillium samsonianum]